MPKADFQALSVGKMLPKHLLSSPHKILRLEHGGSNGSQDPDIAVIGIYRTHKEFVEAALKVTHPFDAVCAVPDVIRHNVFFLLTKGKVAVARHRLNAVKRLRDIVLNHKAEDDAVLAGLPADVRRVLSDKKLASLQAILSEYGYMDKNITKDIAQGFQHTGTPSRSNIFEPDVRLPSISENELKSTSWWVREPTIASIRSSGDKKLDADVWKETLAERDRGWLQGPFSPEEVSKLYPQGWCAARRFGLMQNGKLRCIDDLTEPGTNSAYGSCEKLSLMGLDSMAELIRFVHSVLQDDRKVSVPLSDGSILSGVLHSEWTLEEARSWEGRCLDLRKAYRQLVADPASRWAAVVCVYDPVKGCCVCFAAVSMLFGGTAAVYAFNRASRSLWFALAHHLKLCWTNYYDDYPTLDLAGVNKISKTAVETCLKLLGWDFADEGSKCLPFDRQFQMLGAAFNLKHLAKGLAYVENKPGRVDSIAEDLSEAVKQGHMSSGSAASLKGKLVFAEAQCFGRIASQSLRLVGEVASGARSGSPLDKVVLDALRWLLERLATATPRPLIADRNLVTVLTFTDAASEGDLHTCGGVLIDLHTQSFEYFGVVIRHELISEWRSTGSVQIITHAEAYPVWLVRSIWGGRLRGRRVLSFVDNNGAKDALVRGSMDSVTGDLVLQAIMQLDFGQHSWGWYARVPTASNVADGPSRLDFDELASDKRFMQVTPEQPYSFAGGKGHLN